MRASGFVTPSIRRRSNEGVREGVIRCQNSRILGKMSAHIGIQTHKIRIHAFRRAFLFSLLLFFYCPEPNVRDPCGIDRNWIESAVTLPSAFAVPTTTTFWPDTRSDDDASTDFMMGVVVA